MPTQQGKGAERRGSSNLVGSSVVWETEPRASQMPGKTFTTELHPEPTLFILKQGLIKLLRT